MKINIKTNYLIIPTDNASIYILDDGEITIEDKPLFEEDSLDFKPVHIYLTNDEIIKPGDWCLLFDSFGNSFLNGKGPQRYNPDIGHVLNNGLKKVIATTNINLGLPPFDMNTVNYIISSYNNNKPIQSLLTTYLKFNTEEAIIQLNNGIVECKPYKTNWNYQELSDIVYNAMKSRKYTSIQEFNDWMKENIY
jgi:hypothetical protein